MPAVLEVDAQVGAPIVALGGLVGVLGDLDILYFRVVVGLR